MKNSKKRVGILSAHYTENYGSVLICYSLFITLNSFENITAEVINYIPESYIVPSKSKKRHNKFNTFLKKYVKLGEPVNDIPWEEYDYICLGSGQVWNPFIMYDRGCFETYLLPFSSKKTKKISFASSIGVEYDKIKKYEDYYLKYLPDFYRISIREKTVATQISKLINKKISVMADAVFLSEIIKYKKLSCDDSYDNHIVFYWSDMSNILKGSTVANFISRETNSIIYHNVTGIDECLLNKERKCFTEFGIEEFINLINTSKYIITDTFHGTVLSLLFHIPFYSFAIGNKKNRIKELVDTFKIKDRVISDFQFGGNLEKSINWEKIDKKVNQLRNEGIAYLKESFNE